MCVFYLYSIPDSQQCVKRGSCRCLILSRLLCLCLFVVFLLYLLMLRRLRSNTQSWPNITQLRHISLQPSRGSPSPSAEHLRLRLEVFLFLPALLAQSFVSFTMHVLHGFFFPGNTPTNMKLSQSDSDDSAILFGFGHDDSAMPFGRFGHATRTRPR